MERLRAALASEKWIEFWSYLSIPLLSFEEIGLADTTKDHIVWRKCQESQWVLVTGNRNSRGADSLQETILRELTADSLPVITIGAPALMMTSSDYVGRVTDKLLVHLLEIDNLRGTGRLFVP